MESGNQAMPGKDSGEDKMREIKFRAWCKERNEMGYFNLFESDEDLILSSNFSHLTYASECEIMQYTGLKDKNGKEIYEGDIVFHESDYEGQDELWKAGKAVVEYGDFGFTFREIDCGAWRFNGPEGEEWNKNKISVIGNIYENPELLKG